MELIFELIFSCVGECFLELFFEGLSELGFMVLDRRSRPPARPLTAALGYVLLGTLAGVISVFIFQNHFLTSSIIQVLNLLFTPIIAGLGMVFLGNWFRRDRPLASDHHRFVYGYLFALVMAVIRLRYAG